MIEHIKELTVEVETRRRMTIREGADMRTTISYQFRGADEEWHDDQHIGAILPTEMIVVRRSDLEWQNKRILILKGRRPGSKVHDHHDYVMEIVQGTGGARLTESGVMHVKELIEYGLVYETDKPEWPYRLTLEGLRYQLSYLGHLIDYLEQEEDDE